MVVINKVSQVDIFCYEVDTGVVVCDVKLPTLSTQTLRGPK